MIYWTKADCSRRPLHRAAGVVVCVMALAVTADLAEEPVATPTTPAPRRVEVVALVGTAIADTCSFAVFSGNYPEFRLMAAPGESVAGYTLRSVGFDSVRLSRGTEEIELSIRQELRRDNGGPWRVAKREERFIPRENGPTATASPDRRTATITNPQSSTNDWDEPAASSKRARRLEKAVASAKTAKAARAAKHDGEPQFNKKAAKYLRDMQ
jgi:hypothetical protein